jgi:CPA1 family monovalent cation:H+ antiporter
LAMVVAGLLTGSRSKDKAMSDTTEIYIIKFWELVDVIMNAILFVLIGLSIITIQFEAIYFWAILLIIPAVLLSRFLALRIPLLLARKWIEINFKTTVLMTWGGLRGGLSIAMALSIENGAHKNFIVAITYGIVVFSIIIQGLTVEKLAKKLYNK